jgi:hypothetical protein
MKKNILAIIFCCAFKFDVCVAQAGEWTWMKGSNTTIFNAIYGTQGIPAPANTPQGFYEACEWRDHDGNFWLYGGYNSGSVFSNLWKYNVATNEWTWVKGPGNNASENPNYGTQGVPAATNTPGARSRGVPTWVDSSGNLWLFGGLGDFEEGDLWKYDIATNEWTWVKGPNTPNQPGIYGIQGVPDANNNPGSRHETSATWIDDQNNLWMFGGYGYDKNGVIGLMNDVWKYNPFSNEWTWIKGSKIAESTGSYGTKGVADISNNPPARMVFTKWKDVAGNFWIFGGGTWLNGYYYNDVWKFDPSINMWTWMSGTNLQDDQGNTGSLCESDVDFVGPAMPEALLLNYRVNL